LVILPVRSKMPLSSVRPLPDFIAPELATLVDKALVGNEQSISADWEDRPLDNGFVTFET
jgi:hypothetical protein